MTIVYCLYDVTTGEIKQICETSEEEAFMIHKLAPGIAKLRISQEDKERICLSGIKHYVFMGRIVGKIP